MDSDTIIFAGDLPGQTISSRFARGELQQLARGVYSSDTVTAPERIITQYWHYIVGRLFPNATITDRSAPTGGPTGGYLYLAHDARNRELELPGLTVVARRGAHPQQADTKLPGGLHLASRGRALAENTLPSRSRSGRPPRTLDDGELAAWINRLCQVDGEHRLAQYRIDAEHAADTVQAKAAGIKRIGHLIGAALQTQHAETDDPALTARQAGYPYDPERIDRFDLLAAALRSAAPQFRRTELPGSNAYRNQAFYEAYFSNFIEGTEFTIDEAKQIVSTGEAPNGRAADGHDITGTYVLVADPAEMSRVPHTADELIDLLRSRHAKLLGGRPEHNPGQFKLRANQAGNTLFVIPDLVIGTLHAGFDRLAILDTAWERAIYMAFLVAEVHPFSDGNGRVARVMMNAELIAGGQSKIIVPIGGRGDYLAALRRLSRDDDPELLIKTMRFLHDYTSQIDWSSEVSANIDLTATHGFDDEREEGFHRLTLVRPVEDLLMPRATPPEHTPMVSPYIRQGRPVRGYPKRRK